MGLTLAKVQALDAAAVEARQRAARTDPSATLAGAYLELAAAFERKLLSDLDDVAQALASPRPVTRARWPAGLA